MTRRPHILFVCGKNKRRSPTAERLYRDDPRIAVRSVGTSETSKRRATDADLAWADVILVMERKHAARLRAQFPDLPLPPMRSLDIPDDFEFMAPELIDMLSPMIEEAIANLADG